MNHQRRGKCIIFNHKHFDMVEKCFKKMNDHPENENDVRSLESCFGGLGFEVFIHEDLKKAEIKLVLEALSKEDHSDADCLVFCFITLKMDQGLSAKDEKLSLGILSKLFNAKSALHWLGNRNCVSFSYFLINVNGCVIRAFLMERR
ncbi:caspase-6-like [Panonychus citri]|uniref:caspase-6-like n=1 Tax=Panonychus citri TaxID=50023 RepID=UPI00230768F3|nr:caspase-6-like [Panonychus citri]